MRVAKEIFKFIITEIETVEEVPEGAVIVAENEFITEEGNQANTNVEISANGKEFLVHGTIVEIFLKHENVFGLFRRATHSAMVEKRVSIPGLSSMGRLSASIGSLLSDDNISYRRN